MFIASMPNAAVARHDDDLAIRIEKRSGDAVRRADAQAAERPQGLCASVPGGTGEGSRLTSPNRLGPPPPQAVDDNHFGILPQHRHFLLHSWTTSGVRHRRDA